MDVEKVMDEYEEMFGGIPYFLLMGASDEYIIEKLSECIKTGKKLTAPVEDGVY